MLKCSRKWHNVVWQLDYQHWIGKRPEYAGRASATTVHGGVRTSAGKAWAQAHDDRLINLGRSKDGRQRAATRLFRCSLVPGEPAPRKA